MTQEKMYIKNKDDGKEIAVRLKVTSCVSHYQIAIVLYTEDREYYADLSTFINNLSKNCMVVDTENLPNACDFIRRYKLGTIRGMIYAESGSYPIYEMDLNELEKRDKEGVEKFLRKTNHKTTYYK